MSDFLGPYGLYLTRFLCLWNFPGQNTGAGCYFILQGIFSTQGLNPSVLHFLHWQADSFTTGPPGKHVIMGSIHFSPSWREFQHLHNSSKDMAQKAVYNSWGRTKDLWLHWMAKVLFFVLAVKQIKNNTSFIKFFKEYIYLYNIFIWHLDKSGICKVCACVYIIYQSKDFYNPNLNDVLWVSRYIQKQRHYFAD